MSFIVLLDFLIRYTDNRAEGGKMDILPHIPLDDLFTMIPVEKNRIPVRWWSVKTVIEYLGVSESTVRRYIKTGKVEYKYKTVKGHKRVYICNRSVIDLANERKWKREQKDTIESEEDTEEYE